MLRSPDLRCWRVDDHAVDIDDQKLAWAKGFGATHTINSANEDGRTIRELTGGNGVDVAIEAIGLPEVYRQCFEACDLAGTVVLVGVPRPDMELTLPFLDLSGGRSPQVELVRRLPAGRDFPMLIDLYQQGRLDLDGFVSEIISLDVEEAFHKMEQARCCAPSSRSEPALDRPRSRPPVHW